MMMPRFVSALLFVLISLVALPAHAADSALYDVIGFSEDGNYFAFEEFGIQDGSGFPYSNIYVIDLGLDKWVIGTPVSVIGDDMSRSLTEIRTQAEADAQSFIDNLGIHVPAQMLAANGDGAINADGLSLDFGLPGFGAEVNGRYALQLEIFKANGGAPCMDWFGADPMGYALILKANGTSEDVHRDDGLPRSRGCPETYRISAVFRPFQGVGLEKMVALLSVYAHGFEGLDRRFIAVPLGHRQP